jgi:phosphoenolpyruvate-protein kinase (PTS system EI component)
MGKRAVPALKEALTSKNWQIRQQAAIALGEIGPDAEEALPSLVEELRLANDEAIITAIGKIKVFSAKNVFRHVRTAAGIAHKINTGEKDVNVIYPVKMALFDEFSEIRAAAARALGEMGPDAKGTIRILVDKLRDRNENENVRVEVAHAIGKIGLYLELKKTLPYLRAVLNHEEESEKVLGATREALKRIDPEDKYAGVDFGINLTILGLLLLAAGFIYWLFSGSQPVLPDMAYIRANMLDSMPRSSLFSIAAIFAGIIAAMAVRFFSSTDMPEIPSDQSDQPEEEGPGEVELSGRAWPRFIPSSHSRKQLVKILKEMHPDGKGFRRFIKQFEDEDKVPAGQIRRVASMVKESNSLLPYYFKVTDAYALYKMHQREEDNKKMHFHMYNPKMIGKGLTSLIMIAADDRPGLLAATTQFISEKIPEVIGRKIDIRNLWYTEHDGEGEDGKIALLYFDIVDAETGQAVSNEEIEQVYGNLPESMIGVSKDRLRDPAEKAMRKVLRVDAVPEEEKVLIAKKSGKDRVVEGYAIVLPKIDSSVFDKMICLPWDSTRIADMKIYATISDLEKALRIIMERHAGSAVPSTFSLIIASALSHFTEQISHEARRNAIQRIHIACKDIAMTTMQEGKKARKIRHVLSEKIESEAAGYDGVDQDVANEIRSLGKELIEEFTRKRDKISDDQVESEKGKLKSVFEQVKEDIKELFINTGVSGADIELYLSVLDDMARMASLLIEGRVKVKREWVEEGKTKFKYEWVEVEKKTAAAALLTIIEETEESMKEMRDAKFRSIMRDVITHALLAVGKLQAPVDLTNVFMKSQMIDMEKRNLRDNLVVLQRINEEAAARGEDSPYSAQFLQALEARAMPKIEEGKTATLAVIEVMREMMADTSDMLPSERTKIEATTDFIVETLDGIRLLDDTHHLVREEAPIIIVTNSLDMYRAPKLFEESPQITGIITDGDAPTTHWVIMAKKRVPSLTGSHAEDNSGATANIKDGDRIIIDEEAGKIYVNPGFQTEEAMDIRRAESTLLQHEAFHFREKEAKTIDGAECEFAADIVNPKGFEYSTLRGFKDIGLLRAEVLYQERQPTEEELATLFTRIADETEGFVTIRMFDMQRDKKPRYLPASDFVGTRYLLEDEHGKEIAQSLAKAIIKAYYQCEHHNIRVLFPNVKSGEEMEKVRAFISHLEEEIGKEISAPLKEALPAIRIGGMIETTKAVEDREAIVRASDFSNVGLRDLMKSSQCFLRIWTNTLLMFLRLLRD